MLFRSFAYTCSCGVEDHLPNIEISKHPTAVVTLKGGQETRVFLGFFSKVVQGGRRAIKGMHKFSRPGYFQVSIHPGFSTRLR